MVFCETPFYPPERLAGSQADSLEFGRHAEASSNFGESSFRPVAPAIAPPLARDARQHCWL